MNAISLKKGALIIAIISSLVVVYLNIHLTHAFDDLEFSNALKNTTLFSYLSHRYETWTGRLIIEGVMVSTININHFPGALITASLLLLSYSLSKIVNFKHWILFGVIFTILVLAFLTPSSVEGIFWVTGGYNYIVPMSLGFFSISQMLQRPSNKKLLFISLTSAFISSNNEMFGAFAVLFCCLIIGRKLYYKENIKIDAIYLLGFFSGFIFCISAPGNAVRYTKETSSWMPDFMSLNYIDKITLGVDKLNFGINTIDTPYLLSCALACIFILMNKKRSKVQLFSCLIVAIPVIQAVLKFSGIHTYFDFLFKNEYMRAALFDDVGMYMSYSFSILSLGSLCYIFLSLSDRGREFYFCFAFLISSLAAVIASGLSPTVQASSVRIMFIADISFVIACLTIISTVIKTAIKE